MRFLILLLICAVGIPFVSQAQIHHAACHHAHPQDEEPREHSLNIERQVLRVNFVPKEGRVNGEVTHHFRVLQQRVDTLFFDAPGITIQSALYNDKPVKFTTCPKGVTLHFEKPLSWEEQAGKIQFTYTCTPRKGIYFIGWNDPRNLQKKQIWTQGQGIDNRHWIPSYDFGNDKMVTENFITFDVQYQVLSNGTLVSNADNGDGTRTWHYRMSYRHPNYLLMLGIGQYKVMDLKTRTGVPLHKWYYPEHEDRKHLIYRHSVASMEFLEEHLGIPYPWESYSQIPVADFMYGAMENTTATLLGDFFCGNQRDSIDRNYINVNVHELTHQWFGNLITGRSSKEIWLQESFATFYPKLFNRHINGLDAYHWQRYQEQQAALKSAQTDNIPLRSTLAGTSRWYPKGSAIIDMMMHVYGEESYRRVIQYYLQKHAYGNVETNDLYQAFQDTLGKTPDWFFDQWVYRGGEPHYRVSYEDEIVSGRRFTEIHVEQIHEQHALIGLFKMPIDIAVYYTDGTADLKRFWIESRYHVLDIPNTGNKTIAFVLFDVGNEVLKSLTFRRTFDELQAQATQAPLMIDRFVAIAAMDTFALNTKRDFLIARYSKEGYPAIPAEIVRQLANDTHPASIALLGQAVNHPDASVRKALVAHVKQVQPALLASYEGLLADSSYDVVRGALKQLCTDYPDRARTYLQRTASQQGSIGKRIEIDHLALSAAFLNDRKATATLVDYASVSYEFLTRGNAFRALVDLNYLDDNLLKHLFEAAQSPNFRLAGPAQEALKYYLGKTLHKPRVLKYYRSQTWSPQAKDLLKPLFS